MSCRSSAAVTGTASNGLAIERAIPSNENKMSDGWPVRPVHVNPANRSADPERRQQAFDLADIAIAEWILALYVNIRANGERAARSECKRDKAKARQN